jgi:hypothetical protein
VIYVVRGRHRTVTCNDVLDALALMRGMGAGAVVVRDDGVELASLPGTVPAAPYETGGVDGLGVPARVSARPVGG